MSLISVFLFRENWTSDIRERLSKGETEMRKITKRSKSHGVIGHREVD